MRVQTHLICALRTSKCPSRSQKLWSHRVTNTLEFRGRGISIPPSYMHAALRVRKRRALLDPRLFSRGQVWILSDTKQSRDPYDIDPPIWRDEARPSGVIDFNTTDESQTRLHELSAGSTLVDFVREPRLEASSSLLAVDSLRTHHNSQHDSAQSPHSTSTLFSRVRNLFREDSVVGKVAASFSEAKRASRAAMLCFVSMRDLSNYSQFNDFSLLEEVVQGFRRALDCLGDTRRGRLHCMYGLALALKARYAKFGLLEDVEESIALLQRALKEFPRGWNESSSINVVWYNISRVEIAHALAMTFHSRFEHLKTLDDLNAGAEVLIDTLDRVPDISDQPWRSRHLAAQFFYTRFWYLHKKQDLDKACKFSQEAVALLPTKTYSLRYLFAFEDRFMMLSSHGGNLETRYYCFGRSEDLEDAIQLHRESIADFPYDDAMDHFDLFKCRIKLARALCYRFTEKGTTGDLDECIGLINSCTRVLSKGSPRMIPDKFHLTFAHFHQLRDAHNQIRVIDNLPGLLEAFSTSQRADLLGFYQATIAVIPRIAYIGLDIVSRLRTLKWAGQITCTVATHALALSETQIALELLEAGRSVFWTQDLYLRTSFEHLPQKLAVELQSIAQQLRSTSHLPVSQPSQAAEVDAQRRNLAYKFQSTAQKVRKLPGLTNFLKPVPFATLSLAARDGPVVAFVSGRRNYAILLRSASHNPEQIFLPDISHDRLRLLVSRLGRANSRVRDANGLRHYKKVTQAQTSNYENILSVIWTTMLRPVVEMLELQKAQGRSRPRIWLCTTGLFAFLPLHAAGIYGPQLQESISDYAVVSYTPTIGTLITARRNWKAGDSDAPRRVLLVAESNAPGHFPLPKTLDEMKIISTLIPRELLIASDEAPDLASWESTGTQVLQKLPEASILHLACHGTQDQENALESGFLLKDGKLSIAQLMTLDIPSAYFAFLSACQSASGDRTQPDETVHLGATMMFVGFRTVIGTMWSMNDTDGPQIAEQVYKVLFQNGRLNMNADDIPYALDDAVKQLRCNRGARASRWATYIHIGI